MPKKIALPVGFDYPYDIDKFTALTLNKLRAPSSISPGDPLGETLLIMFHMAGIADDDGYTCVFRSFKIAVYELTVASENQLVETKLADIWPQTLPERGVQTLPIIGNHVTGVDGTRLYFEEPYGQGPGESDYPAYYVYASWGSDTIPSWMEMPGRGEGPQVKMYRFRPEARWDLYRDGVFKQSVTQILNIYTRQKAYCDWEVTLMPPPPYPSMIIDDAASYFPTQIEHDQPFGAPVKITIGNSVPDAKGTAYLDLVYKGKRTPLAMQPISGTASFEYSPAAKTIETLLGTTFFQTTFIVSSELKFVAGYVDDAGQKKQTNEWLRGVNVTVAGGGDGGNGGGGTEPEPPEEASLLDRIAVPVVLISGVAAAIGGAAVLLKRRR